MSIRAAIHHLTHYKYDRPVSLGPQIIRLRPAPHSRTRVISHSLKVTPAEHFVNHQQDPYGNWLARYVFPELVRELKIEVDVVADMTVYNPFDFFVEESAEIWPFEYGEDLRPDLIIYRTPEPAGPRLQAFLDGIDRSPKRTVDFVGRSQQPPFARDQISHSHGAGSAEPGGDASSARPAHAAIQAGSWSRSCATSASPRGSCPAISIQLKPDLVSLDGPPGTDHDFTDLHAWAEVYLPGAGWIGLDPTSGLLTGESHIPLAATPHYRNAAPISGLASFANVDFAFDMRVERVAEHPRITKPFSEEAWKALDALGEEVDKKLVADDVRLTMGGEPTFVSIDDFESGEWNTDAVGPTKRELADRLIRRLRDRFAPGGFLHYGQGKWYPGESLPRWTFSLYWRRDGKPIWLNPQRIAVEGMDSEATGASAHALLDAIASELGVASDFVAPAYEDPAEWIVKEANLPANVSPENSKLKDPEERHRIARVFSRGLTEPSGYVLPVQRWQAKADGASLAQRKMEDPPRRAASRSRRQPGRLPPAARRAALRSPGVLSLISSKPTRPSRAGRCPISTIRASAPSGSPRSPRRRRASRSGSSSGSATSTAPSAPRSRSKRATGICASSCRRSSGSRTISNSSPRRRRRPSRSDCRCRSRAIRPRPIRA